MTSMPTHIREEAPGDAAAIRALNDAAFGTRDEGALVDALRAGGHVVVSLVAVDDDGRVVGHILFSTLTLASDDEAPLRAAALAPMAVAPSLQRRGVGSALVRAGLDACRARGVDVVIVLGHPAYYPRFGFSAEAARALEAPYSGEAFMALDLREEDARRPLRGIVTYAPPFGAL